MKSVNYHGYVVYEDGTIIGRRGKPMQKVDNGRGYLIVSLYLNKRTTTKAVHVLVAKCFVPNPDNLPEVDHKDGNKTNNHYTNLRWVTRGKNIEHCYTLEGRSATGIANANSKLSEEEVEKICSLLQEGFSQAAIRDMGYPYGTVRAIKQRRQWLHISSSYHWS